MTSVRARTASTVTALTAMAGCGGPSDEERRSQRASYERSATPVCETVRAAITPRRDLAGPEATKRFVARADAAVLDGSRRLHGLRATLGDSADSAVTRFDDQLDAVDEASRRLNAAIARMPYAPLTQDQADSVTKPAERARRAFAKLYSAAKAARLSRCGRGGSRLVDAVLLAAFRDRLGSINDVSIRAYRRLPPGGSPALARVRLQRTLRINVLDLQRQRRLHPPSTLQKHHAQVLRLDTQVIALERRMVSLLSTPTSGNVAKVTELSRHEVRLLRRGTTVLRRMERIAGVKL